MISSVKNEKIKFLQNLAKAKDILCLDSPKLIKEAQKNGFSIVELLKTENISENYTDDDIVVSDNVLKKFSNTITSQGVIAFIKFPPKQLQRPNGRLLVLDRLQDPGNVGTLIRSAVGSDFLDIYLISCASVTNSKTVRSTMGALFKANLYEVNESCVETLKSWQSELYIADMDGDDLYQKSFEANCGVVVGNEGKGVSDELIDIATQKICIPMKNNLESLNAGVSGSIIMYQIANGGKNVRT